MQYKEIVIKTHKPNIITKKDFRLLILSDLHCGHYVGLTHPDFHGKFIINDVAKHNKLVRIEKELWQFFEDEINSIKPIQICVVNGDAIDGKDERWGGNELITTDRDKQICIAKKAIDHVGANHNVFTFGTPYHTGKEEDWEEVLAREYKAKIGAHEWLDINGRIFDIKHSIGSYSSPLGRFSPLARERVWSALWQERNLTPRSDFIIRSHVHYFSKIEDSEFTAITTPALQGMGTKFGSRKCSGLIDFGFIHFDIKANGDVTMVKHIAKLESQIASTTVIS